MSGIARSLSRSAYGPWVIGVGSIVLFLLFIEFAVRAGIINQFAVPPPSDIVMAFPRIIAEEHVGARFLDTAFEAVIASVFVALLGISAGVLLYRVQILRLATETWVAALAAAPTVLLYPLFLVIFGRNATTIIMMGIVAGLAPVTLKTLEGLTTTRRVLINVGRSFNLTDWQMFRMILFPAALPTIFVGVRLGLVFALINIVGVEFLINFGGLGAIINELSERFDLAGTYAAICFVILVSVMVFVTTERAERWLTSAG
jgi:ABC-type nitrate/sulfonate/bicarbonate transport system permease component